MARTRVKGKTSKSEALGISKPIGKEALFAHTKTGGLRRLAGISEQLKKKKIKSLPKSQRLTLHDLRMAGIALPMALGSAYVGFRSGKKIVTALKKRTLKQNIQDIKEDARKNILRSLDIQEEFFEKKKTPFVMKKPKLFKKKAFARGGNPYYRSRKEEEEED